jgi:putative nucleotidyltransferase with HDIG domain
MFRFFYAAVVLLAVGLFVQGVPHAGSPHGLTLALVLTLMLISEAGPISLPSGGYTTGSAVFDLPSLIILGPLYTATLDLLSTLIVQGFVLRKPPVKVVFNLACFAITDFAAGHAFLAAGGHLGQLSLQRDVLRLLVCGGVYFLVNSTLVSIVIGLTSGPDPWRIWQRNFQSGLLHHLSFVALGTLVAVTYLSAGPWGLLLFAIPFVVSRQAFRLYVEIRSDLKDFVRALTGVLDEIDPFTRQHSARVAEYCVRLARGMRLSESQVEEIEYAALVHDLGKIGPHYQNIIRKSGGLSQEDRRKMREHPAAGAEIVAKVRALHRASQIVCSHHEQPDGCGYPYGLHSIDVPLGARILKVSDAFDAMTSDRPYRRALTVEAALLEIERNAGTQFDAAVVACLLRLHAVGQFPLLPSPSREDLELLKIHSVSVG